MPAAPKSTSVAQGKGGVAGAADGGMDPRALKALEKLLVAAEKNVAGTSSRAAAITSAALADYRSSRTLRDKDSFEAAIAHAQAEGAVRIIRPRHDKDGFIERIELVDLQSLARVLGRTTVTDQMREAEGALSPILVAFPVIEEVLKQWRGLRKVRGSEPADYRAWLDAASAIQFCRALVASGKLETPLRIASTRHFNDSKRIERLGSQIDVLLVSDLENPPRDLTDIWQELGLYREEQPVRMSGLLSVRRARGSAILDRPYGAFPASTILGLDSKPSMVLTIENLTTFHIEARSRADTDVLCIYSMGMPSPAWMRMYADVLRDVPVGTPVCHWGDIDQGGFRIAAFIGRAAALAGHRLQPWRMSPAAVPEHLRVAATDHVVQRMVAHAREAGWSEIADEIHEHRFTVEQEGLT